MPGVLRRWRGAAQLSLAYQVPYDSANDIGALRATSRNAEEAATACGQGFLYHAKLILNKVQNRQRDLSGRDVLNRALGSIPRQPDKPYRLRAGGQIPTTG